MLAVLLYPILKWVMALDVFARFVLMIAMWNRPGHPGWTFVLHFAVLTAYTLFVSSYNPDAQKRADAGVTG